MIVLDASVLIAHAVTNDAHHDRATALLLAAEEPLAISTLTLAEFLVEPARRDRLAEAEHLISELAIETVEMPADAPRRLAVLRADTRVRLPDCCVLLAAEQRSAAVATFDESLARAATRLGLRVLPA